MTKWRPARQRPEFQNYPGPLGRICTQPLEVLEDRKGDAGIGHESGVAAPNWLIADSTVRGLSDRDGVKGSTWKLRSRREPCGRHVSTCAARAERAQVVVLPTHRHWQLFFFSSLHY